MVSMQLLAAALALTGAGETVLLDFQADWCGPCKMMEPAIDQLAAGGYPVRKVDIDRQPQLAQQYGVTSVPCLVLLVNGQERARQMGAMSVEQLQQMLHQANVRPAGSAVAAVRGQSPGRRRFGWPRSRAAANDGGGGNIPRVSLGEPVAAADELHNLPAGSPGEPTAAAASPPPTAAAATSPSVPAGARAPTAAPPLTPLPPRNLAPPRGSLAAATTGPPAPASAGPPPAGRPATSGPPPTAPAAIRDGLIQRLTAATVRLKVRDRDGHSWGSGTIIDFRPASHGRGGEAVVLTCGHIFRNSAGQGPIQVDLFDGSGHQNLTGQLVRYDLDRDIGLVRCAVPHAVRAAPLATSTAAPRRGSAVLSIGCDHGRSPTAHRSHVMAVNSFIGPPNLQVSGQPAIGRSGGGLFNERGELIGVCNFADPTDRAGLYAAVAVARDVIDQAGLVLTPPPRDPQQLATAANATPPSRLDIGSPGPALPPAVAAAATGSPPTTEVICIVRSHDGAKTDRQVIVIEDASTDLIQQLAREQQRQQQTFPTTMATRPPVTHPPVAFPPLRTTADWQPQWQ
ncbi:MAG: thioredoxin fold domain-containing protein [Planctomycetales bacterium]|nr:thioredoxin fold domain-containing protein [Planctomycetales bacterium]